MNNWKKSFGFIWTGQLASMLSSSVVNFAIILWISLETGSAMMLAWGAVAGLLPQFLLSPIIGVYVDRHDRKKIMIYADAFIALTTLALAILFYVDAVNISHVFVVLALRSVGTTFHQPAMQASVPMLAPPEQMERIAGVSQAIMALGSIAGPAIGALLISIWKMESIMMLDVVGAVLAIISLLFVSIPNPPKTEQTANGIISEIKDGVREVLSNRGLAWAFLFSFLACMVYVPLSSLFPLLATDHFGGAATEAGNIQVAWAAGFLIGGLAMGLKINIVRRIAVINLMYIAMGVMFSLMGFLPEGAFIPCYVAALLGGVAASVFMALFTSLMQTEIRPDALGRVFAMFYTLSILPSLISLIVAGVLADSLGVGSAFVWLGILMAIIGAVAFIPRSSRMIDRKQS